ncbi:myb-related transcription factor, partner of profilin isoform X2 [Rhineura floridana]|uniref:myb-related transcription factor, partner of profilin isoform X2 n=1 Tax=Rhineura floridana TaxID=261503 RepID=UPI002AC84081|nr:myb-related transcription factor, partner of profilin isoform X2 [Rhineura floridana]
MYLLSPFFILTTTLQEPASVRPRLSVRWCQQCRASLKEPLPNWPRPQRAGHKVALEKSKSKPNHNTRMSGESEEITRLRKPRFSYEENQILIQEVRANYAKLYGTQSRRVTVAERRRVWEGIATKINNITSWKRTGQEVQKRWNDFKRRTKEKLARVPHSTQGAGNACDETFSAEEETIFAILGPGVMMGAGGAEPSALQNTPGFATHSYRLAAEHGTDMPARSNVSCSPEMSARAPCCPLDGGLLRPKERDSPAPPSAQPTTLQIVQLAPSPTSLGCRPHREHSPVEPLVTTPCPSTSPPLRRRHPRLDPPVEPPLDFLQAQRETSEAIRELTYTLRQGLERLTDVVAALLPLLPVQTSSLLHPQGEIPTPTPAPSAVTLPPRDTFTTKVEPSPEQGEDEVRPLQEEGQPAAKSGQTPSRGPPPQKRRKGIPTRKRRGRWKNL